MGNIVVYKYNKTLKVAEFIHHRKVYLAMHCKGSNRIFFVILNCKVHITAVTEELSESLGIHIVLRTVKNCCLS